MINEDQLQNNFSSFPSLSRLIKTMVSDNKVRETIQKIANNLMALDEYTRHEETSTLRLPTNVILSCAMRTEISVKVKNVTNQADNNFQLVQIMTILFS